jgi:hypothetical protein
MLMSKIHIKTVNFFYIYYTFFKYIFKNLEQFIEKL